MDDSAQDESLQSWALKNAQRCNKCHLLHENTILPTIRKDFKTVHKATIQLDATARHLVCGDGYSSSPGDNNNIMCWASGIGPDSS